MICQQKFGLEAEAEKIKYAHVTRVQDKIRKLFCDKSDS